MQLARIDCYGKQFIAFSSVPSSFCLTCKHGLGKKKNLDPSWQGWQKEANPVENLSSQLTGSSHWNSRKLILRTLSYPTVNSQDELTLWAFREFATPKVSSLLPLHGELIGIISWIAQSKLAVWVANSQKAHRKLIVWAHLVSSLHELTGCRQNEPTVR